jgi:hypothetical protein
MDLEKKTDLVKAIINTNKQNKKLSQMRRYTRYTRYTRYNDGIYRFEAFIYIYRDINHLNSVDEWLFGKQ